MSVIPELYCKIFFLDSLKICSFQWNSFLCFFFFHLFSKCYAMINIYACTVKCNIFLYGYILCVKIVSIPRLTPLTQNIDRALEE